MNLVRPPTISCPVGLSGAIGDGVADDTAAIQRLFNSGIPCFDLGPYTYAITSVTIPSTVKRIMGWGPASRFVPHTSRQNTFDPPLLLVNNSPQIELRGFAIDGIDPLHLPNVVGINVFNSRNARIEEVDITGGFVGLMIASSPDCRVRAITVQNYAGFGVQVTRSLRCRLSDIVVYGGGTLKQAPIQIINGSDGTSVSGATVLGAVGFGIAVFQCGDIWIRDSYVIATLVEGIQFTQCSSGGATRNTVICLPGHTDMGISVDGPMGTGPFGGVLIAENQIRGSGGPGIGFAHNMINCTMTGNYIESPCQSRADIPYGVWMYGSSACQNNSIHGNHFAKYSGNMAYNVGEWDEGLGNGVPNNNRIGPQYGVKGQSGWARTLGAATQVFSPLT